MARILLIDDERSIRVTIQTWLGLKNHKVETASSLEEGRAKSLLWDADAVILDVFLQGEDGLAWLSERSPLDAPVIVISGQGDLPMAVRAVKMGAFDFLEKPLDPDHLLLVLDRALERSRLHQEVEGLKKNWLRQNFVQGESAAMNETIRLLQKAAPSSLSLLIIGPSGSGKEGLAQAVHLLSQRSTKPFVPVNCAAIPDALFESELFGHRKGAFTGAAADRLGYFQRAHGGTLFLDEIAEIPLEMQAKLLRAVETGEIHVVGAEKTECVDVRIVAATNKDLPTEIKERRFREDLFFRLNQVLLRVPALSERTEDIPALVDFFRRDFLRKNGGSRTFTTEAVNWLKRQSWPGNVRELRALIERALVLSDREEIDQTTLDALHRGRKKAETNSTLELTLPWNQAKRILERDYLQNQLNLFEGKILPMAKALDMLPNNLSRKLKDLGIT